MRVHQRQCVFCRDWFQPQPHNAYRADCTRRHQRYCTQPECQAVRRRVSHRKSLRKHPDKLKEKDAFRDAEQ